MRFKVTNKTKAPAAFYVRNERGGQNKHRAPVGGSVEADMTEEQAAKLALWEAVDVEPVADEAEADDSKGTGKKGTGKKS